MCSEAKKNRLLIHEDFGGVDDERVGPGGEQERTLGVLGMAPLVRRQWPPKEIVPEITRLNERVPERRMESIASVVALFEGNTRLAEEHLTRNLPKPQKMNMRQQRMRKKLLVAAEKAKQETPPKLKQSTGGKGTPALKTTAADTLSGEESDKYEDARREFVLTDENSRDENAEQGDSEVNSNGALKSPAPRTVVFEGTEEEPEKTTMKQIDEPMSPVQARLPREDNTSRVSSAFGSQARNSFSARPTSRRWRRSKRVRNSQVGPSLEFQECREALSRIEENLEVLKSQTSRMSESIASIKHKMSEERPAETQRKSILSFRMPRQLSTRTENTDGVDYGAIGEVLLCLLRVVFLPFALFFGYLAGGYSFLNESQDQTSDEIVGRSFRGRSSTYTASANYYSFVRRLLKDP